MIRKIPMQKIRARYKKLTINRKWIISLLVIVMLSFFIKIGPVLFMIFFCVANAFLLSLDRYINAPLDLEFSTFSAVLMTMTFGLTWGIAAAIMTKVAAIIYNRNIRADHFFMILGYVVSAFVANMFNINVVALGILATVIVNIYTFFVSRYVTMLSSYEIMAYGSSNLIFNVVLFIGFSEPVRYLMVLMKGI